MQFVRHIHRTKFLEEWRKLHSEHKYNPYCPFCPLHTRSKTAKVKAKHQEEYEGKFLRIIADRERWRKLHEKHNEVSFTMCPLCGGTRRYGFEEKHGLPSFTCIVCGSQEFEQVQAGRFEMIKCICGVRYALVKGEWVYVM